MSSRRVSGAVPRVILVFGVLVAMACGSSPAARPPVEPATTPRAMAIQLLEVGIGEARPDVARALISPNYKQHNPRVPDGPEGLLNFVERFQSVPRDRRPVVSVRRSIVDGDYVVTHAEYLVGTRAGAGVDMFRVEDGLLAEHWDAGMREPASPPSGHSLIDGETSNGDLTATDATRTLIRRFAETVLVGRSLEGFAEFFHGDALTQHDPDLPDGAPAWREALATSRTVVQHDEVVRVLAEGQLAVVQSRGMVATQLVVVYDLFRVSEGRIVEHWSVREPVPAESANPNGMF